MAKAAKAQPRSANRDSSVGKSSGLEVGDMRRKYRLCDGKHEQEKQRRKMGTLSVPQTTRPFGCGSVSGRSPDRAPLRLRESAYFAALGAGVLNWNVSATSLPSV